jgi:hypothetical protein
MKPDFTTFASLADLRFQPTAGQLYADLGSDLAILDSRSGIYYGLDPVGARIWSLLLDLKSVAEIRNALLEEYEVEPCQVEGDVAHLLGELFTRSLIELALPGAEPTQKSAHSIPEFR